MHDALTSDQFRTLKFIIQKKMLYSGGFQVRTFTTIDL